MKLIFIHGAPASGKLTVARALLRAVLGRLFDNHAAIDLASTVLDFGAPGFWDLVDIVRLAVVKAAAGQGVPFIATTCCYSPEDLHLFEQFEEIVTRHGGSLLPVFLACSKEETARRVGRADRVLRKKTASMEDWNSFCARYNIMPVPRDNCLALDTETTSPDATAGEIIRHFGLLHHL